MALQLAVTSFAIRSELAFIGASSRRLGQRLGAAAREWAQGIFDPYRPELHYMRGPGPKWREKHRAMSVRKMDRDERIAA
jgi:hypothetical protein